MDILFVHGNYPGQFKYIAPLIAVTEGNRVVFITSKPKEQCEYIKGINIVNTENHRQTSVHTHHYLHATEHSILEGQGVVREIIKLKEQGFNPKLVVTHAGVGLGMFIKDIMPDCIHIGYFEWYFRPKTAKYLVEDYTFDQQLKTGIRNHSIMHELESCDVGVVPTEWQRKQFPKEYQKKLKVIFDGVDRNYFRNQQKEDEGKGDIIIANRETGEKHTIKKEENILSYATRGMEPIRGFPEFMQMLPALLKRDRNLKIVIAGADRRAYSYEAPSHGGSWKDHLFDQMGNFEGKERIVFTGLLTYTDYRKLLWRTNLHCYLTRPYVTSWSLFEAAACGTKLAINKTEATEGIVEKDTATLIDIDDPKGMIKKIESAISNKKTRKSELKKGYELSISIGKWELLINKLLSGT